MCQSASPNDPDVRFSEVGSFDPREFHPTVYLDKTPLPGASLGSEQHNATGTLGMYVYHDTDVFALSNHHVAFPCDNDSTTPVAPYLSCNDDQTLITMLSPSNPDHQDTLDCLSATRFWLNPNTPIDLAPTKASAADPSSMDVPSLNFNTYDLDNLIQSIKSFKNDLGLLVASSGLRPPPLGEPRLDWCLIKCIAGKEYSNKVSPRRSTAFCSC